MDCSLYVISSPLLYSIALLTGYVIAKIKNEHTLQNLQDYNEKLQHLLDETQEKLHLTSERLSQQENIVNNVNESYSQS